MFAHPYQVAWYRRQIEKREAAEAAARARQAAFAHCEECRGFGCDACDAGSVVDSTWNPAGGPPVIVAHVAG